eukprot:5915824-Amphidinium_carterae.1
MACMRSKEALLCRSQSKDTAHSRFRSRPASPLQPAARVTLTTHESGPTARSQDQSLLPSQ